MREHGQGLDPGVGVRPPTEADGEDPAATAPDVGRHPPQVPLQTGLGLPVARGLRMLRVPDEQHPPPLVEAQHVGTTSVRQLPAHTALAPHEDSECV